MNQTDPNIDAYIAGAAGFARPVMNKLRKLLHDNCPDIAETTKWGFPHFEYRGKILFSMAAFKAHCACGFRLAPIMKDPEGLFQTEEKTAMGHLGRITSLNDLPSDKILIVYLKEAMLLTEQGASLPKKIAVRIQQDARSEDFERALHKNKTALVQFRSFPPSKQKDYIQWITEAKQTVTREKRIQTAIEWISEGKGRNWKYEATKK